MFGLSESGQQTNPVAGMDIMNSWSTEFRRSLDNFISHSSVGDLYSFMGLVSILRGLVITFTRVTVTPYVASANEIYFSVNSALIAATITLPAITTNGQVAIINDADRNCNANNITIQTTGGATINGGVPPLTLNVNGDVRRLISNQGTNNWEEW